MTFEAKLAQGQIGEGIIARYLNSKGYYVVPVYEKEIDTGKGPQVFGPQSLQLIAPDLLTFGPSGVYWIEAKTKTRFSFYGRTRQWVTGIDLRHYGDYIEVQKISPWPIWLLFLHMESKTWPNDVQKWNAPPTCPVGLFGAPLDKLQTTESHRSERHGKSGMVYWRHQDLALVAPLSAIHNLTS